MRQLRDLTLDGTSITDDGLVHLKGFTNLRCLSMGSVHVTDGGLHHLKVLPQLEQLNLAGTQVTDAGLKELETHSNLCTLELEGTQVRGPGLDHLAHLENITCFDLSRTPIKDAGIAHIASLSNLQVLNLKSSLVTFAPIEWLRTALPACEIHYYPRADEPAVLEIREHAFISFPVDLTGYQVAFGDWRFADSDLDESEVDRTGTHADNRPGTGVPQRYRGH